MSNSRRWYNEDIVKEKKKTTTIRHKQQLEEEWIKEQEESLKHINEDQLGDKSEIAHT